MRRINSRAGFATVVYRALQRAKAKLVEEKLPKAKTKEKEFLKRSQAAKKERVKRAELKEFLRRSEAAEKGWVTRRKNIELAKAKKTKGRKRK